MGSIYTPGEAAKIIIASWMLAVFIGGGFLIISSIANTHLCNGGCPWPLDTCSANFWHRALLVVLGAIPVSFIVLGIGILYQRRSSAPS